MQEVIIWDFDRTLGYRQGGWRTAIFDALEASGHPHSESPDSIRPFLDAVFPWDEPQYLSRPKSHRQWWSEIEERVFLPFFSQIPNLPLTRAQELSRRVEGHYYQRAPWQLISGARQALRWAQSAGYANVILTNNGPGIRRVFTWLDLDELLDLVVVSGEQGAEKPHPEAYRSIIDIYSHARLAWMVGDNPWADVAGANNIGIKSILIGSHGYKETISVPAIHAVPEAIQQFASYKGTPA